jgi:hypothetical protein
MQVSGDAPAENLLWAEQEIRMKRILIECLGQKLLDNIDGVR